MARLDRLAPVKRWRRSARQSAANFPMICWPRWRVGHRASFATRSISSWARGWSSAVAACPKHLSSSSTPSCRMPRIIPCYAAGARNSMLALRPPSNSSPPIIRARRHRQESAPGCWHTLAQIRELKGALWGEEAQRPIMISQIYIRFAPAGQLCQRNCCGLRAAPCEITTLTRAGPRWFIASSRAPFRSVGFSTKKPLPLGPAPVKAGGFHHPVVAGAVDQGVGLHVEHRVCRDLGHAGADAAIVEDDDPRLRGDRFLTGKL